MLAAATPPLSKSSSSCCFFLSASFLVCRVTPKRALLNSLFPILGRRSDDELEDWGRVSGVLDAELTVVGLSATGDDDESDGALSRGGLPGISLACGGGGLEVRTGGVN